MAILSADEIKYRQLRLAAITNEELKSLEQKIFEAMEFLEIPDYGKNTKTNKPVHPINKQHLWDNAYTFLHGLTGLDRIKGIQIGAHIMRVALYSLPVMNYLGVKEKKWRQNIFAAHMLHDINMGFFLKQWGNPYFDKEDMEQMKYHVHPSMMLGLITPAVSAIASRSHYYRDRDPYPENPRGTETPEIKLASQALGIVDSQDAASTRINNKTDVSFIGKHFKIGLASPRVVKEGLLDSYRNQVLVYEGKKFSRMHMTGPEFIEEMYSLGVFGSGDPINPFKDMNFRELKDRAKVWPKPKADYQQILEH